MANKYLNDTGLGHFWDKTAYKYGVEYIVGTQAAATNVWTGVTLDKNCVNGVIPTGKVIVYKLPQAGNNSNATLNLTFPDGSTTGNIGIRNNASSGVTTHYGAGCNIFMVFDGTYWKCSSWYDSNNYDRIRHNNNVKAATAISSSRICVGNSDGYKIAANAVTSDISYPILWAGSNVDAAATSNNFYDAYPSVNLTSTKSGWSGTANKMVFLVGSLSGTTFTVNSDIFTQTVPSSADSKVYTPIGLAYSTTQIYFFPTNIYWEYRNGAFRPISGCPTLATVATSGSYNDLSNKPTIPAAQVQSNWTQTTTTAVDYIKNKPTLATVATSGSYNDLSNKPTIPTVNNATLTIQKNGTTVKTFTANASSNVTANITVPTNTNELTNGAGFITSSDSITGNAATATKATQDSDGNAINTTYLKKTGGDMSGAITRTLSGSGTTIAKTNLFTVSGSTDGFAADYESTTADVGITTLYTTDDANAQLSLGNKVGSSYKEAINITNGVATVNGNASTATKLAAGKTIAIGTGATGTATSFDGSSNITIPITNIKEAYATWGGKNIASDVTPDDMGCIDEFGHNKLAFLPAECIEIKYSTDGGSTWVDYGASDANKVKMVSTAGPGFYVGGSTDNATADNIANLKLRIRIAAGPTSGGKVYTAAKKILINVSTQGCSGNKVDIKYRTIANYKAGTETWTTVGTYDVAGGSGWNSIPFAYTFGGSFTSQTSQMGQIEFVFYSSGLGTWGLKKLSAIDFRMIGSTNWTMPSEMARAGHLYTVDEGQNATFPANVSVTGSLKHGSYTYTLPNKTGTVAMTSDIPTVNNATLTIQKNGSNVQTFTANASSNVTANITVPTKTSDITNDSNFITNADSQKFAIGQGSTQPVFDDMTPVKTIEWDVSDTTYRPIYQIANTGWTYINMDITVAYRVTVTGTNINSVTDVVDRWINPASYPLTSMVCRTLSNSAATTGLKYLRAVYPTSSYLNNTTYPLGMEVEMHNTTARHIKVEVFKDNLQVTWNTTKPSGSIYVNSTYNGNRNLEVYGTRGWRFHQPTQMYANSAGQASYMTDFEAVNTAVSELKSGATALVAGHYAYLADDGLVYDISDTTHNIAMGESKIGFLNSAVAANTAISWTYWRSISRPSATQVGYFSHGTLALGNRVFLRCTRDANGNIHSDNYLATSMSAGYTWMPFGWARSATQFYADTRFPMFYTLDSNGKLSHVNGLAVAGTSYTAGSHINISGSTISAKDYVHSESGVSASTVTQTVTNDMIANGTIKFAKVDSTEFVKLTMSTTDISAGSALAKNTLYGVYV